ncbi:MAG: fibronectin type III domain-containing protein [Candidatus Shapirobacteria bacterium]|jgi:sugar lactone lactonase YvrE
MKVLSKVVYVSVISIFIVSLTCVWWYQKKEFVLAQGAVVSRGISGDFWADTVIGKRDFGEIAPREVVPFKVSSPGGTIIDRSVSPGRLYVWDSGNSRILGINLANCYSGDSPCSADLVIGQPSASDYGACNQDASFDTYPNRRPASASTLCGMPESTRTTLEDKSFVSMFVDDYGNLFVADSQNNRVLKFISPFTTDTVADEVWGQADFSGNQCNISGGIGNGFSASPPPTAFSICFHSIGAAGGGVTIDKFGNLWVADGGNNRVLRFPRDTQTGIISKTADVVLGQPNFTTGGDWSYGSSPDRLHGPGAVRYDGNNARILVADTYNNRVLQFSEPFSVGMSGAIFGADHTNPVAVEIDPDGRGIFVYDNNVWSGRIRLWDSNGTNVITQLSVEALGGGSVGIDSEGSLLPSSYVYGQDVYRFTKQSDGSYLQTKRLFSPPYGYNFTSARRFEHPGFVGVAIAGNQLIAGNNRVLFWNDKDSLVNGQTPDGYVGVSNFSELPNPGYEQIKVDSDNRVWIMRSNQVVLYQAPLSIGASAVKIISSPIQVLGGGQVNFDDAHGLAITEHSEFLWVSDTINHRVFRIRTPLTDPVVDVVLGQNDINGNECNRGVVPQPNSGTALTADLNMLCYPGALAIDKKGNLYVSDHYLESAGNWRLLMFSSALFPSDNAEVMYATFATKSFPRKSSSNSYPHMTFEPTFNSLNQMVVGQNPYGGNRFVEYYNDPALVNQNNPSDPEFAKPDGYLSDFYNWPVGAVFDSNDDLYVFDANRGQIRIYKNPIPVLVPTSIPTPTNTPTPIPIPTAQPIVISAISATNITSSSVVINWTSSNPGTSRVSYGVMSIFLNNSTTLDNNLTKIHSVKLSGLSRGRKYYYKVHSKNASGVEYSSSVKNFTTKR